MCFRSICLDWQIATAAAQGWGLTGVEHVVLDVPAEGGEHHAHVHPGQRHPSNAVVQMLEQTVLEAGQVVEVPRGGGIVFVSLVCREAAIGPSGVEC